MEPNDAAVKICRMESVEDNVGLSDIIDILNTLDSPSSPDSNGAMLMGTPSPTNPQQHTPQQQQPQAQHLPQQSNQQPPATTSNRRHKPCIKILEQPAGKALRFRYKCEGRSAGSIPGTNSTPENKTFPSIEIVGFKGDVVIVVSLVTKDPPYRPHPHNLVGRECKNGICTLTLTGDPLRAVFSNLGIQCVKKKEIKSELDVRESLKVDPFRTKFAHKDQPSSIDLNTVRLCFQAFLKTADGHKPLTPVVTDPIYDKKAMSDLVICRLCSCSAKVGGGDEIIMLCEKVAKDDIKVKFYELNAEGQSFWEDYAEFQQTDIHKQTAIVFKTPRYHTSEIMEKTKVFIQLLRPSDGVTSESLPFEYYPDPGTRTFTRIRRKLKRKQDLEIFQQILSLDSETTATKYSCPPTDPDAENDEQEPSCSTESSKSNALSSDTLNEFGEAAKRPSESDTDGVSDERVRDMEIELEVPQINFTASDEATQTSTPMEDILKQPQLEAPRQLSACDKINEWMRSSEFERTDSLTVENGDVNSLTPITAYTNVTSTSSSLNATNNNNNTTISFGTEDEDKSFNELLDQVAELDEMYADQEQSQLILDILDKPNLKELPVSITDNTFKQHDVEDVGVTGTASTQASVDIDETFDDTSTYTSLQIAFKNPIDIPLNVLRDSEPVTASANTFDEDEGLVILTNPPAPKIKVNAAKTPQTPPTPTLPIPPPRTPSPIMDQMLPPLPPKRIRPQENICAEHRSSDPGPGASQSRKSSTGSFRPPSQIIIMRTPDQSPTKRRPGTPSASPKKKQGFFSRFFSRRKSKTDLNSTDPTKSSSSKATSPTSSREPSIGNFSLTDANRSSVRSVKSLQPHSPGLSPLNGTATLNGSAKSGKPVGRSSSSVSGKRPAYLDADVIHIPLKGDSASSFSQQPAGYSSSSTITLGNQLDRKTLSALQLADIPIFEGNMELVAIADRQSIRNLCEGAFGVQLDPSVNLFEAEHFALYTSIPPQEMTDGCDENASYYQQVEAGNILTADDIARRLAEANGL